MADPTGRQSFPSNPRRESYPSENPAPNPTYPSANPAPNPDGYPGGVDNEQYKADYAAWMRDEPKPRGKGTGSYADAGDEKAQDERLSRDELTIGSLALRVEALEARAGIGPGYNDGVPIVKVDPALAPNPSDYAGGVNNEQYEADYAAWVRNQKDEV